MSYKVTAIKTVKILANVLTQKIANIGGEDVARPGEQAVWITLKNGEARDGLGLVFGVHPSFVPDELPTQIKGHQVVNLADWTEGDLPKEFFGLFKLAASTSARV